METAPQRSSSICPGSWLGPYRIFEVLGDGAFGTVFRAAQVRPFRRTVAVKVLHKAARLAGEEALARFETERQATASLTHSAIAQIFDAGSLGDGTPYFVMEYVPGIRITDFCDKHKLTLRQRCELFLSICDGIAYAHAIGIVHRDITPSNVLAFKRAGSPVAKVIDFGIAKIMHNALPHWGETLTAEGQLLGTPGYMSPEQASHTSGQLDGRADVYGLGALLYELLTGLPPIPQQEIAIADAKGLGALVDLIKSFVPKKASERLADAGTELLRIAECRSCSPADLRRTLAQDFDTLLSCSLELSPLDRPKSVETFRELIVAALDKTRVVHSTARWSVAMRRWTRSLQGIATVGVIAAGTVLGVGATVWQQVHSRQAEHTKALDDKFVRLYWQHANLLGEIQRLAESDKERGPATETAKEIWNAPIASSKGSLRYVSPYHLLGMPDRNVPEEWSKESLILPTTKARTMHLLDPEYPERRLDLDRSVSYAGLVLKDLQKRLSEKLDDSQDPPTFDVALNALRDRETKLRLGDLEQLGQPSDSVDAPRQHIRFVLEGRFLYKERLKKVNELVTNWNKDTRSSARTEILNRFNRPTPASLRVLLVKQYADIPTTPGYEPTSLDSLKVLLDNAEARCSQSLDRVETLARLVDKVFSVHLKGFDNTLFGTDARSGLIDYLSDAGTSLPTEHVFEHLSISLQELAELAAKSKRILDLCDVLPADLRTPILTCFKRQIGFRKDGDHRLDGSKILDRARTLNNRQLDELCDTLTKIASDPPNPTLQSEWLKAQPPQSIDALCVQLKALTSP